jgi:hypothetical protein
MKMIKHTLLILALLAGGPFLRAENLLTNNDFAKGTAHWEKDGKVVYLDPSGKIEESPAPDRTPVLHVPLKNLKWSLVEQHFELDKSVKKLSFRVVLKASDDFKPAEKEDLYDQQNFQTGGSYVWSSRIFPKIDFMVQIGEGAWWYRLYSLKPGEDWKELKGTLENFLGSKSKIFSLCFPPGDGSVLVKSVSVEAAD